MSEERTGIIKAATNEWVLMAFRAGSSLLLVTITGLVGFLVNDGAKTRDALNAFIVTTSVSLAETKGKVDVLSGRSDAQAARLTGIDTDIRSLWSRLYDMTTRGNGSQPKASP